MMVLTIGCWLWHLSSLHRFDDLVDKIVACIGAQVLVAGDPPPRAERVSRACVPVSRRFPQIGHFPSGLAY
jgi:hypothetical protein